MNIEEVYRACNGELPVLMNSMLKQDYVIIDYPKNYKLPDESLVAHCGITGSIEGDFAVIFEEGHRETIIKNFLEVTVGEKIISEEEQEATCLEISNIILGHLTEIVRKLGYPINVLDLNTISFAQNFIEDAPAFKEGNGSTVMLKPTNQSSGRVIVWNNFSANPSYNEGQSAEANAKARVLIVDDSMVMRSFLEKIYIENGYEVVGTAVDGADAIEKYEATRPDIMTLDIIMPKMKGTEVLERIITKYPEAKVLMATSVKDARIVMKCLKIGAKRYIIKPYDSEAVISATEKILHIGK